LNWLLLACGAGAGIYVWVYGGKDVKFSAVLIAIAYAAILIHGLFLNPREELRKHKLEYIGFAAIFAFWLLLTVAVFVR
jgi:hypothetical protein